MWVIECTDAQTRQSIQVQDLLEVSDLVCSQVDVTKRHQAVQSDTDLFDIITSKIQMLKPVQGAQACDLLNLVAVDPELFKHDALLEAGGPGEPVPSEVKLFEVPALVDALDVVEIVMA